MDSEDKGNFWVEEIYLDADAQVGIGESGVYETKYDSLGELYRALQAEFGRCTGKMYVDVKENDTILDSCGVWPVKNHVVQRGWVFLARCPYDDVPTKTYLREVWVTVWSKQPVFRMVQVA
jgi:hypothetical protein